MPAPRSSSSSAKRTSATTRKSSGSKPARKSTGRSTAKAKTTPDAKKASASRILKPFDLVMLTRERIQETLDDAAERGRVTRHDANELVAELVRRGRQQTDDILADVEQLLGRGREQIGNATKRARRTEPVDRLVRSADRARRTVGVGPSFPILGYDELTASQVGERLRGLTPAELRKVRDYERRHANRKSVLAAIEKALG
jgi:polyhydroxyalkanoate synthesis regulator phasin